MKGRWPVLYEDRRLGGEPIVTLGKPKDWGMRIPDIVPDCVAFFYVYGSKEGLADVADHGGTGFFVSMLGALDESMRHMYLVTAKHVATEAPKAGDGRVWLRYTAADGDAVEPVEIVADKWRFHPDPSVDVAVTHFDSYTVVRKDRFILPIPITVSAFLTDEKALKYSVGVGDDLSVVGLFRQRPGLARNIPVVRHGIISAMPGEPIPGGKGLPSYVAYLAEIRSTRGLSGSPVFVNLAIGRKADGTYDGRGSLLLIGLVRGHFERRRAVVFDRPMTDEEAELAAINSGIAMVTPISAVTDILNSEACVRERMEREREMVQAITEGTTLDSGFRPEAAREDADTPGPEPERLTIDLPMDEAVKKMFGAGKPPKD